MESRSRLAPMLVVALVLICAISAAVHLGHRVTAFQYPTHSDQDDYLRWGREAATSGRLQSRAPLYSLWVAAAFLTTDGSLTHTQQVERAVTLVLLAALTGLVAGRIVGASGGILAACWVLSVRYLVGEPNGSHSAAAIVWMAGVGLLTVALPSLRPPAAFLFCMSTQLRSDMWLPTLLAVPFLLRRDWHDNRLRSRARWLWWGSAALLVIAILAAHSHELERTRISVLFRQSLSITHLERTEGLPADQLPWSEYEAVWARVFPDTPDSWSLISTRPGVLVQHVSYQTCVAVRALAADVLAIENPWAFVAAWALWVAIHFVSVGCPSPRLPHEARMALLVLLTLVPLSCIFRVAARNFLQLVPAMIIVLTFGAKTALLQLRIARPREGE